MMNRLDILDVASAAGHVDLFVAATEVCGIDALAHPGEAITVFAPTDTAFGGLSDTVLARLLDPEVSDLRTLVRSHVARGLYSTTTMIGLGSLRTLTNERLDVDAVEGLLVVGGAIVLKPDLQASNGVLHVVDRLLVTAGAPEQGQR